ncbi:hypothetical protein WJX84_000959 [Apatococcus fuscideae]|uniref:Vacuolar import/degradation Vid27 C-terminal domain-containing protein n=1 Tax=Apatococcus fuscideae TaxID=2026836 RepID=A0AAW1SZ82_9CHLO
MGNAQSATPVEEVGESLGGPGGDALAATPAAGNRLFKFTQTGAGGRWTAEMAQASVDFFNKHEDRPGAKAEWCLAVGSEIEAEVNQDFTFEENQLQVAFVAGSIWALRFPSKPAYQKFCREYEAKLFENMTGLANNATNHAKVFGGDSLLNLSAGQETLASQNQWVEDMEIEERRTPAEEEADRKRRSNRRSSVKRDPIYGVRLGGKDRSYLIKNGQIDVLRNVMGGVQDLDLSVDVTPTRGPAFTPSKVLLMNRERRMNMLSPEGGQKLWHTDIETGKVVSEWGFEKDGVDAPMRDIVNDSKSAQMDDRDTFMGIGSNRLVRWDMRAPSGIVSDMGSPSVLSYKAGHDYKTKTDFQCVATSGDGYVAVGSTDGQVRLYNNASDKSLNRASTSIPGLGLPITAIDITFDGKWVIATTKSYLMVVKTVFRDKQGKETNAFKSRAGSSAPQPRLLRLKLEDADKTGHRPLAQGKFTWVSESGRQERWIVATCGLYTVLWNFRVVREAQPNSTAYGGLTCVTNYELIEKHEQVVDSACMPDRLAPEELGHEDAMVIVTKHQVFSNGDDD